jgi:putative oxidoreductase
MPGTYRQTMVRWAQPVRWIAGIAFVLAGIAKFAFNAGEVSAFDRYGLPWPHAFVAMIGVVEIAGGALLLIGLATRPAALILGAVMVGAIVVSGIGQGEVVPSLTAAPALLVAMLFLLWSGPGLGSGDERRLRSRPAPG